MMRSSSFWGVLLLLAIGGGSGRGGGGPQGKLMREDRVSSGTAKVA